MGFSSDYQNKLFPYAYNILGSIDDSKDVIQDVVLNYIERKKDQVNNESAYLIKSVINKSINLKQRKKKLLKDVTWLPEPVSTEGPDSRINKTEVLSYSLMVLLEHLNPKERAVFILKKAFEYSHQEIAETFNFSVDNSRQLLSRAMETLKRKGLNFEDEKKSPDDSLHIYLTAIRQGEVKKLEAILSEHITAFSDGGGKKKVLSEYSSGKGTVARLISEAYISYLQDCRIEYKILNYHPALLFYNHGAPVSCHILDFNPSSGKIRHLYVVVDPKKLENL